MTYIVGFVDTDWNATMGHAYVYEHRGSLQKSILQLFFVDRERCYFSSLAIEVVDVT